MVKLDATHRSWRSRAASRKLFLFLPLLGALLLGLFLIFSSAVAGANCQFVLGFATLRDLIGHEVVGDCLENQRYAANGNSEQHTTGGLLVWRKADNLTSFTDGYRTWINGPNGLVQRLNTERFVWEADYAPGGGIAMPRSILQVEVGQNHACVLESDGLVTCWGEDAAGQ
ncbi:MAG: RCC1 domain-containing protein [Chloroflexota bacterium]|nr:RCC1 domain-containing protein [Chloroflexota bacterium]